MSDSDLDYGPPMNEVSTPGWDAYPEIPLEQVKPLWVQGYWDGPLSGVCEFAGTPCYFNLAAEIGPDCVNYDRYCLVHRFSSEQWEQQRARHRIWQERVGTHSDYVDGTWKREHSLVAGYLADWDATIAAMDACGKLDLAVLEIVGWFKR